MQFNTLYIKNALTKYLLLLLFISTQSLVYAQTVPADSLKADSLRIKKKQSAPVKENINKQYDFGDLTRNILHPKKEADTLHKVRVLQLCLT